MHSTIRHVIDVTESTVKRLRSKGKKSRQEAAIPAQRSPLPVCFSSPVLLLVMLDDFWIAYMRLFGAESRVAARASLAQQVPALIQADLELLHTRALLVVQPDAFGVLRQFVFFLYQLLDVLKEFGIGHG